MTALGLEHATQRVTVPDRAQPLSLRITTTEQSPDHLVGDPDETRRIVGDEIGHGKRVLAAVEAAAQAARPEGADRQGLDRRRIAPQPLRGLEHVEDTVGAVGGMAVGLRAGILVDGGDPRLELRLDGGADLVDIRRRGLLERREQRRGGMFALAVDQAGTGAGQPDPATPPIHDVDPGQIGRSPLATHPPGNRPAIPFNVDLNDGTLFTEGLGSLPGRRRKKAFQIGSAES